MRGVPALAAMVVHLDGLLPVLGEERLLQARLSRDEVEQLVAGGRLDNGSDRAAHAQAQDVVVERARR